ncbi:MAG TPA: hypothetical protein VEN81_00420, partial [Planctomycetota bacterium]|nr:hypothetical protein [Planctomycetota bacterium]
MVGVVVLVLVAALVAGFIPGVSLFSKSGGGSTPAISSTGALSEAGTLATAHDAGALVLVAGVSTTYSFQGGKEAGNASCPVHDALASNFTVPAQTGSYSSGDATLWVFVYVNTVGDNESMIAVAGTNTYFLGTVSGSSCVSLSSLETLPG